MKNPFDTPERVAFRETCREFIDREILPYADTWDEAGSIPWGLHEKAGALGLFGFGIGEEYGGLGFDDCFMRAIWAEAAGSCGATGVVAALGGRAISIGPIDKLASKEIKDRCLADIIAGRKGSSLAITEPGGGSDVAAMQTTAKRDGNHWVINGSKTFITSGMTSDHFVVGARTSGDGLEGISLFFIDADADGFSRTEITKKMGWWASDQATLYFDDCRIPAENLMGAEDHGFGQIMHNFNYERLGMIAQCVGMMKTCLNTSIEWAQQRKTFGKPLIRHQVIRHKIADMSARIDATEAYCNQMCWQANNGQMPVAEISKGKFFATKGLEFCASEAMQILGGAGYLRGNPVERIYREVKVMAIGGGSEEIMRDLAVRQMGL
ncbi:acyl-CoA dehydrogenase family protein [Parasphingorhabdus sp. DH2-15]|uniref:acyl-CoA dehydrogenase family protein n=1 Tax=Parasphingorhabdus sp. DH2-15 TaxID=3444112 RepID=UPI003F6860B8